MIRALFRFRTIAGSRKNGFVASIPSFVMERVPGPVISIPLLQLIGRTPAVSHWGLSTGANRSENVAALASRAAASEDEIKV